MIHVRIFSPFDSRIDWKSIIKAIGCRVIKLGCHGFYICWKEHWVFAPCTFKIIRKGMVANIQHPQNRAAIGVMPLEETLRPRPARRKRQSKTMIRWTLLRIAELSVVLSLLKFATSLFHLFLKSHVLPFRGIRTQKPERPCMRMKILAGCNGSYYHTVFVLGTVNVAAWMTSDAQPNTHDVYRIHLYSCMKYVYIGILELNVSFTYPVSHHHDCTTEYA